ncbi:hypothetical protein C365_04017, partial [Cryptococcus neoformans Bt85]
MHPNSEGQKVSHRKDDLLKQKTKHSVFPSSSLTTGSIPQISEWSVSSYRQWLSRKRNWSITLRRCWPLRMQEIAGRRTPTR